MARYRTGRKVGNTLYLQQGAEPADDDLFIGSCVTYGHARAITDDANASVAMAERLEALEEIRQRVADGWVAVKDAQDIAFWSDDLGEPHPMPDSVAAVLWPSTEDEHDCTGGYGPCECY